jgi:hypothetical protein
VKYRKGYRSGPRSGSRSRSKWTNQNLYDPGDTEVEQALSRYRRQIENIDQLCVIVETPHQDFLTPFSEEDIRGSLARVPAEFTKDLQCVVVLKASRKQARSANNQYAYGRYFEGKIFLHPFPRDWLDQSLKKLPPPPQLIEYKRIGAHVRTLKDHVQVTMTSRSVREFYLRDVMLHELGHHVDETAGLKKSHKRSEGYADWFAQNYGYRSRR